MIELLTKMHDIFYKAKLAEQLEEKLIKMNQKYDKLEEKHHKLVHALNFNGVLDCHACFDKVGLSCQRMLLCPKCGNKRCPKASDHNLECTNSNEPGQEGSLYVNHNYNMLPRVDNNHNNLERIINKWTTTGIYRSDMLMHKNNFMLLLENEMRLINEFKASKEESTLLLAAVSRIYRNNKVIQACDLPAFKFVNSSESHVVSTKKLVTTLSLKDLKEQKNIDKAIDSLKKEIDAFGECVVYTPLIPLLCSSPVSSSLEDKYYAFAIRLWKSKQ